MTEQVEVPLVPLSEQDPALKVPALSLRKLTEPDGATGVVGSVSATVTVHTVCALTGAEVGLQLREESVPRGVVTEVIDIDPLTSV